MLGGAIVALLLIAVQVLFATGASIPDYLQKILHRAGARSAGATHTTPPILLWQLCNDLLINYGGYALIAYTAFIKTRIVGFEKDVLFIASFPLLETFVLLEHDTVYGFGQLKWLVPVVVLIAVAGNRYATTTRRRVIFTGTAVAAALLHIALFWAVFRA